jgi:ABC-2 type transport system ATP-binding protein
VQQFVETIRQTHDATMLLTTHDMPEADRLCDRLAIIDNGKIVAIDTPAALKARSSRPGKPASLEDVFMEFTGRSLEDGDLEPDSED